MPARSSWTATPTAPTSTTTTTPARPTNALLVAHHAPAEARLLFAYREHCPNLARIDLLDTVRLAKNLYPELPKHGLSDMLQHLQIPSSPTRHRAMADVQVTTDLFIRMVTDADWADLRHLRRLAGYPAEAARLHHRAAALFEHLAAVDSEDVRLLDRRPHDVDAFVATISEWIATAPARPLDILAPP